MTVENILEEEETDSHRDRLQELSDSEIYGSIGTDGLPGGDSSVASVMTDAPRPSLTTEQILTTDSPSAASVTTDWLLAWSVQDADERDDHPFIPTAVPLDESYVTDIDRRIRMDLDNSALQFGHAHSSFLFADALMSVDAATVDMLVQEHATGIGAGPDDTAGAGMYTTNFDTNPASMFNHMVAPIDLDSRLSGRSDYYTVVGTDDSVTEFYRDDISLDEIDLNSVHALVMTDEDTVDDDIVVE